MTAGMDSLGCTHYQGHLGTDPAWRHGTCKELQNRADCWGGRAWAWTERGPLTAPELYAVTTYTARILIVRETELPR